MTLPVWLYGALGVHCVSPQPSRDVRVWGRCLPAAPYVGAMRKGTPLALSLFKG